MSNLVALIPTPSFNLIRPFSSNNNNALASFVVSFGTAMVAPVEILERSLSVPG
jgi:hypothetical protein